MYSSNSFMVMITAADKSCFEIDIDKLGCYPMCKWKIGSSLDDFTSPFTVGSVDVFGQGQIIGTAYKFFHFGFFKDCFPFFDLKTAPNDAGSPSGCPSCESMFMLIY